MQWGWLEAAGRRAMILTIPGTAHPASLSAPPSSAPRGVRRRKESPVIAEPTPQIPARQQPSHSPPAQLTGPARTATGPDSPAWPRPFQQEVRGEDASLGNREGGMGSKARSLRPGREGVGPPPALFTAVLAQHLPREGRVQPSPQVSKDRLCV